MPTTQRSLLLLEIPLYFERLDVEVIELLKRHTEMRPSRLSSVDIWLLGSVASRIGPTDTLRTGVSAHWAAHHVAVRPGH